MVATVRSQIGILLWLGIGVCSAQVERRVDLGDGYDAAVIAKKSDASFESVGFWEFLRFKGKEICLLGRYALSPDGKFIAFQELNTGKVFLYDKRRQTKAELASEFPGLARTFDWKAKPGFLVVEIQGKNPLVVPLPGPDRFIPAGP